MATDVINSLELTELERYVIKTLMPPDAITPSQAAARRGISTRTYSNVASNLRKRLRQLGIHLPDGRTTRGTVLRSNAKKNGVSLVNA